MSASLPSGCRASVGAAMVEVQTDDGIFERERYTTCVTHELLITSRVSIFSIDESRDLLLHWARTLNVAEMANKL
jgi:hypothetical protein